HQNLQQSRVEVTINSDSIDSGNSYRDKHLKSSDFLDVKKFATISFVSKSVKPIGDTKFEVLGALTIHGVTRDVVLSAEDLSSPKSKAVHFKAKTSINRFDYELKWNQLKEGVAFVSDKVDINLDITATRAP